MIASAGDLIEIIDLVVVRHRLYFIRNVDRHHLHEFIAVVESVDFREVDSHHRALLALVLAPLASPFHCMRLVEEHGNERTVHFGVLVHVVGDGFTEGDARWSHPPELRRLEATLRREGCPGVFVVDAVTDERLGLKLQLLPERLSYLWDPTCCCRT